MPPDRTNWSDTTWSNTMADADRGRSASQAQASFYNEGADGNGMKGWKQTARLEGLR